MENQTIIGLDFDDYEASTDTHRSGHTVGDVRRDQATGKTYLYVQAGTVLINDAMAANEVLSIKSFTGSYGAGFVVTNDVSAGLDASYPWFAGRANSACPESTATVDYFCWVQISGLGTLKTDAGDDIAINELVTVDETVDGACDRVADNTTITDRILRGLCGRAYAADGAATVTAALIRPFWL